MAKGKKTGGRTKGVPNRRTVELQEILSRQHCEPEVVMCQIVNNTLTCGVCRGKKKTPYRLPALTIMTCPNCKHKAKDLGSKFTVCPGCGWEAEVRTAMRKCMSCLGTTLENCSPSLRGSMASELIQYTRPKRKAIEVTGADGESLPTWAVVLAPEIRQIS